MKKEITALLFVFLLIPSSLGAVTATYYSNNQTYIIMNNANKLFVIQSISIYSDPVTFKEELNVTSYMNYKFTNNDFKWKYQIYIGSNGINRMNITGMPASVISGQNFKLIITATKTPEDKSTILLYPNIYGFNLTKLTWWNTSIPYRINTTVANGTRPRQIYLNISNGTGNNNATWVFGDGNFTFIKNNNTFVTTNIYFIADNITSFPFWFKNISSANTTSVIVLNLTSNFTNLEMYYGGDSRAINNSLAGISSTLAFVDFNTWSLWTVGIGTWNSTANGEIGVVGNVGGVGTLYKTFSYFRNIELNSEYRIGYTNIADAFFVRATTANGFINSLGGVVNPVSNRLEYWDSGQKQIPAFSFPTPPKWYNMKQILDSDNSSKMYVWLDGTIEPTTASLTQAAFTVVSTGTNLKISINDAPDNALHIYKYFYVITYFPSESGFSAWSSTQNVLINIVSTSTAKIFTVNFDFNTNAKWYLNGTNIQTDNSITTSTYSNSSEATGVWNVTVIGTNPFIESNIVSNTWVWSINISTHPEYVSVSIL